MSSKYRKFSSFTRGSGGGRLRPDYQNRHYILGSRGRGGSSSAAPLSFPSEANIKKGLDKSKVISTIPSPPRPSALEDVPIENVQYVASYNWVDKEEPTIVVPGTSFPHPSRVIWLTAVDCRFASCVDHAKCPIHLAARQQLPLCAPERGPDVPVSDVAPLRCRRRDP